MSSTKRARKNLNSITQRHYRRLKQIESMKCCNRLLLSSGANVSTINSNSHINANKSPYNDNMTSSGNNENCQDIILPTVPSKLHTNALHTNESSMSQSDESISSNIQLHQCEHIQSDQSEHMQIDQTEYKTHLDDTDRFKNFLTDWALRNRITHSAVSTLLQELKSHHCFSKLPHNARTLFRTITQYVVKTIEPGEYIHFGLRNGVNNTIKEHLTATTIEVAINVDGLPLSKSASNSFWPILGTVLPHGEIFIIGLYHGIEKPKNVNDFLHDFVSEAKDLYTNGIIINNFQYTFKIKYFICDAPAKSYLLQCRGHTGYYSCTKCTIEGSYKQNRICFPEINAPKRTDEQFRMHIDDSYHISYTVLEEIPGLDLVKDFVLDYMHLICLGITRKLFNLWVHGNTRCLQYHDIERISVELQNIKHFTPKEFARKPRSLKYLKMWKATEYRQILLYTGPIVLKSILSQDNYNHFISLHVTIRILCNENLKNSYLKYAETLIKHFIESFGKLYGKHYISHNVHNLYHLTEDVNNFGILDNFSAFKFENFLQTLKKMIRKSEKPLQQVFRRYHEAQNITTTIKKRNTKLCPIASTCHFNGPLLPLSRNPQFTVAECSSFKLDANSNANDCCGLQDNTIILLRNIAYSSTNSKELVIIGHQFECKEKYYSTPCDSSVLGIYVVSQLSKLKLWPLRCVNIKYAKYSLSDDKFIVIPLLHNEMNDATKL